MNHIVCKSGNNSGPLKVVETAAIWCNFQIEKYT